MKSSTFYRSVNFPWTTLNAAASEVGEIGLMNDEVKTLKSDKVADSDARLTAASKIISASTGWSAAAGAIPVPLFDIVALGAVQASMISKLAKLYGETLSSDVAKSMIGVMLGTLLPAGAATGIVRYGAKAIPGAGYFIGAASMIALGAAATYAMGKVFLMHFERGGTLLNFDPEAVKADLKREFNAAGRTTVQAPRPGTLRTSAATAE